MVLSGSGSLDRPELGKHHVRRVEIFSTWELPPLSRPSASFQRQSCGATSPLPCPTDTCQWASSASAGIGSTLWSGFLKTGVDSNHAIYVDRPACWAIDAEGCGLNNEGTAWEPMSGGAPRWPLLGFARPVYVGSRHLREQRVRDCAASLAGRGWWLPRASRSESATLTVLTASTLHLLYPSPHATSHHCAVASCGWRSVP